MKKLLLLPFVLFIMTSCSVPTQQEIDEKKKICDINGEELYINNVNEPICLSKMYKTTPMECIKEYTNWIDEKYNNPDTVRDLREDEYSNVVKTCNEVFGKTLSWSSN